MKLFVVLGLLFLSGPALAEDVDKELVSPDSVDVSEQCGHLLEAARPLFERFENGLPYIPQPGDEALLSALCSSETYLNLSWQDEADLPCNPAEIEGDVPAHRVISAGSIELFLSQKSLYSALLRPEFDIRCAQIEGNLNLSHHEVPIAVTIRDSHFTSGINLSDTRFGRELDLAGGTFDGSVYAADMRVDGDLVLSSGTHFRSWVNLSGTQITGSLDAQDATFDSSLNLGYARVSGFVDLSDDPDTSADAIFGGWVNLNRAVIGGTLVLSGTEFRDDFDAEGLKVGRSLFMSKEANFKSVVNLIGAEIGKDLQGYNSVFEGGVRASGVRVGRAIDIQKKSIFKQKLDLNHAETGSWLTLSDGSIFHGEVNLSNAKIGSGLTAVGSVFEERLNGDGMIVEGSVTLSRLVDPKTRSETNGPESRIPSIFKKEVLLRNSRIGGNLWASGSIFEGPLQADAVQIGGSVILRDGGQFKDNVNFIGSKTGTHFQFGGSSFEGQLDLTGAEIGRELLISSPKEIHGTPNWGENARLILRNVEVAAFQAELKAWTRSDGSWVQTDLTGFRYDRLGGLNAEAGDRLANMADAPVDDLVAWITESQMQTSDRYDPQPYEQLASAFEASGAPHLANKVRYARFDHLHGSPGLSWGEWSGLWISKAFIGHGIGSRPLVLPLIWFVVLVVLGVLVGIASKEPRLHSFGSKVWFSIENTLPFVEPETKNQDMKHGEGWGLVHGFFRAQKILGFLLATLFIAALTVF